jgi:hypothetical protein
MAEFINNLNPTSAQPAPAVKTDKNPLAAFFRQPKIWISLPSKGEFYPEGALEKTINNEYPVFAMTARDELLFKTPDALMNGAATVEVIRSCVPNIKDGWAVPSLDVDAILVAIRIATYGEEMDVTAGCPKCETVNDLAVDLRNVLDSLNKVNFNKTVEIGDSMLVHLRPMDYNQLTKVSLKAFEHQRIFSIINDDRIEEQEKVRMFQESFVKLTDLTIDSAVNCISKIESTEGSTDNPEFIREFLTNADKSIFQSITDAVNKSKESGTMSSFKAKCSKCEHEWSVDLNMDSSDFFGSGFRR